MAVDNEKFIAARRASGLTVKEAAELANITQQTYIEREKKPEEFRVRELKNVYFGMSEIGKGIMREAVADIFLP